MKGRVRTVLGDIVPADLGRTDYHEHVFHTSPLLPGEDLDDATASANELHLFRESGFDALIDATPLGLGRDAATTARISAASGVRIVLSTGAHRSAHYRRDHPLLDADVDALTDRFLGDLEDGADGTTVRAGHIKTGIDYWRIDAFAHRVLEAAARAHQRTGAPVMVHLEHGSAGLEVLDALDSLGVPPARVALAHVDRNPDHGLHAEYAATGAYVGYDGVARYREWPESVIVACLAAVVDAGHGDRVLLGGDVARRSRFVAYGGMPGLAHLGGRFVPRLEAAIGVAALDVILRANAARYLTWAIT